MGLRFLTNVHLFRFFARSVLIGLRILTAPVFAFRVWRSSCAFYYCPGFWFLVCSSRPAPFTSVMFFFACGHRFEPFTAVSVFFYFLRAAIGLRILLVPWSFVFCACGDRPAAFTNILAFCFACYGRPSPFYSFPGFVFYVMGSACAYYYYLGFLFFVRGVLIGLQVFTTFLFFWFLRVVVGLRLYTTVPFFVLLCGGGSAHF